MSPTQSQNESKIKALASTFGFTLGPFDHATTTHSSYVIMEKGDPWIVRIAVRVSNHPKPGFQRMRGWSKGKPDPQGRRVFLWEGSNLKSLQAGLERINHYLENTPPSPVP